MMTATYDPADNKLRLRADTRLSASLYAQVKAAGFSWAPRQELFVAPSWTPEREDFLTDLCGEIGDEDTSLVERAEQRAERFTDYREKRADDAERAHQAVAAIADGIPLGQPILVGHHSQRRAEKDAERIENGMRRAVKLWETSEYWKQRAAGARAHARYKELPEVRYRRIKTLEADKRRQERNRDEATRALKLWNTPGLTHEQAVRLAGSGLCDLSLPRKEGDRPDFPQSPSAYSALSGSYPTLYAPRTLEEVLAVARETYPRQIVRAERWIAHYDNRLAYERAMLDEGGGIKADTMNIGVGGSVLRRGVWMTVLKVNLRKGEVISYTVSGHWKTTITPEEVEDYRPPAPGAEAKARSAMRQPPLCNYPGEGFVHMTKAEWDALPRWSDFSYTATIKGTATQAKHRVRQKHLYGFKSALVFLTDAKRTDPPAPELESPVAAPDPVQPQPASDGNQSPPAAIKAAERAVEYEALDAAREAVGASSVNAVTGEFNFDAIPAKPERDGDKFDALKESLRAGVKVVSAPQLFPTPPELASRLCEWADVQPGQRILEPSAGTGNIIRAIWQRTTGPDCCRLQAVEMNAQLVNALLAVRDKTIGAQSENFKVKAGDFLECNGDLGLFDRVVMNPPFGNAADIQHVLHARKFLKPGGRLAAIVANGPRQQEALKPIASRWIDLRPGTFAEQGTNVNTAVVVIDAL